MKSVITNLRFILLSIVIILISSNVAKAAEVDGIYRGTPTQQNTLTGSLKWNVFFDDLIQSSTLSLSDFNLNTLNGDAIGVVTNIVEIYPSFFEVHAEVFSGTGDVRLDFTGQVTDFNNKVSQNTFSKGDIYSILPNVTVKSIVRNTPANQNTNENFVTWTITFDRAINSSSVSASDFSVSALDGQLSGNIISAFGFDDTYYVSYANINKDATLRLDFIGFVTDNDGIAGFTPFFKGETYIVDFTSPKLDFVHISTNNKDDETLAHPKETVAIDFIANEKVNIVSSNINGIAGLNTSSGTQTGKSRYTFNYTDIEGPILFSIIIEDMAGNRTTFGTTTDGSYANFEIPPPYVILISQPDDVVECEGSLDQFLFVIAAPSDRKLNIAYRWWKDGRPHTEWQSDIGQLNFDTLDYRMSGKYKVEMFVYDKEYNRGPFSFEAAKVSETVFSEETNLYVLQMPSFLRDIPDIIAAENGDVVITFDANIYGEHNMEDPTYWTDIQWFKDTLELEDNFRIQGTDASILSINNIKSSDYNDNYRVRLMSDCDTIWSNGFGINPEPKLVLKSYMRNVFGTCINREFTLTINVKTDPPNIPIDFQFYMDDEPIFNELDKYKITYENNYFNFEDRISIAVKWHKDFENNMIQVYNCEFWPRGYKDKSMRLEIADFRWHKPIELIKDIEDEYIVEEGQDIEFGVEAKSNFILYQWFKDNVDYGSSGPVLTIEKAALFESGLYLLIMTNACGLVSSKETKLTVTPKQTITGIEDEFEKGVINVYPNPLTSNSILNINADKSGEASVILTDLLGNRLAELYNGQVIKNESKSVNLNVEKLNLSSGTYYIIINLGGDVETRQISVVR